MRYFARGIPCIILAVTLLAASADLFSADQKPAVPIKVYCSVGSPPKGFSDWSAGAEDSLHDFKKALSDRPGWVQPTENQNDADLRVEVLGRHDYSGFRVVWFLAKQSESNYSLFGNSDIWRLAAGNAAETLIQWVKLNYDPLRKKLTIPGGKSTVPFPFPFLESERAKTSPLGPRLKVFCTAGDTPEEFRSGWDNDKNDSLVRIRSYIGSKTRWIEVTDDSQSADLTLRIVGRQNVGINFVNWMELSVGQSKIDASMPLIVKDWDRAAEEVAYRLDILAAKQYKNIQIIKSAGGVPNNGASEPTASNGGDQSKAEKPLMDQDIIDLVKAGLDEDNTIATIQSAKSVQFDLSPQGLKALMAGGVSNKIIAAMQDASKRTGH
jgi:hypothetical protein